MSIFDNLGSNLSTLADSLGGFLNSNKQQSSQNATDNQLYRTERWSNLMATGQDRLSPNPRPGQYAVTPSKAASTVDPEELKNEWLRRLDNYTTIAAKTGVKIK